MVREIPGYFFDASKNKYFKIQANHVAPTGSPYSREFVNNQQAVVKTAELTQAHDKRSRKQQLCHSQLLNHPQNLIDVRLGLTRNMGKVVREYYGAGLARHKTWPKQTKGHFDIDNSDGTIVFSHNSAIVCTPYLPTGAVEILDRFNGSCCLVAISKSGLVIWVTSMRDGTGIISRRWKRMETTDTSDVPTVNLGPVERGWTVDHVFNLATSPNGTYWAAAQNSGIWLGNATTNEVDEYFLPTPHDTADEYMYVSFKEENLLMIATRSSSVLFHDHRITDRHITRLQHDSPITHLHPLSDSNLVLVNGFDNMSIYDLRYTPRPRKSLHSSNPYMTFNIGNKNSDRHSLGFAYSPSQHLVARASSTGRQTHHVTLYSTTTGRPVSSRLNTKRFQDSVACIKFANVRDGPESLVLSDCNRIQEWLVQGTDKGDGQE